jgi:cytoskeletal protein RodZ
MESLGEKLKSAREERGYSIEQVARDTNIARRFIIALEEEDFDQFPGDTYLLGFLRNYSEYLGLDPSRMSSLYKNMQLQEQPAPMEELIERRRGPSRTVLLIAALAVLLLAGGGAAYYFFVMGGPEKAAQAGAEETEETEAETGEVSYEMTEEILERRFGEEEVIGVRFGESLVKVKVLEIGESIRLRFPAGTASFTLGDERPVDLDGDGTDDIRLGVYDIDSQSGTAVLRFDRSLVSRQGQTAAAADTPASEAPAAVGSTTEEARKEEVVTVLTAEEPEPFTISAVMRGYCMLRYQKDGEIRDQRYFDKGESFRLDVSREAIIWVSNAGAFNAKIRGEEVSVGESGEVAVKMFRWEQNEETGDYTLLMIPVY